MVPLQELSWLGFKEDRVIENFSQLVIVALITAAILLSLFLVWNIIVRSRRAKGFKSGEALEQIMDARLEEGERPATIISEQIEEQVKKILEAEGKMMGREIDFATASDGSLEIWIEGKRYKEIDEIPDEDVRVALKKAVDNFNR
jgi:flagellar biosynthesis/type III secretory pathway M-ring protein FliF/YscJ